MLHCNYGPATDYSPVELNNLWAHYAAETELVDRHLGRILQKIDDLALWTTASSSSPATTAPASASTTAPASPTSATHDERYWPIYPEVGHVPFLIAGGDVPRGKRLDMLAQPIDIQPTVSDLAGIELEPPEAFEGRSFAPALRDSRPDHRDLAVTGNLRSPRGRWPSAVEVRHALGHRWTLGARSGRRGRFAGVVRHRGRPLRGERRGGRESRRGGELERWSGGASTRTWVLAGIAGLSVGETVGRACEFLGDTTRPIKRWLH